MEKYVRPSKQIGFYFLHKKQNRKNKEDKYIGFKNGLTLNEAIKDTNSWNKDGIEKRTDDLAKEALALFKL